MFSHFYSDTRKPNSKQKMVLLDGKVARTCFQRCLVFEFFSFSDSFWKNMFRTKFVVQTLLFRTKKIDWFRSRQDGLRQFDIYAKTFALHIKQVQQKGIAVDEIIFTIAFDACSQIGLHFGYYNSVCICQSRSSKKISIVC